MSDSWFRYEAAPVLSGGREPCRAFERIRHNGEHHRLAIRYDQMMPHTPNGIDREPPRIQRIEWSQIELADGHRYRDAKLFPGGSREWDWNETGTRHEPGIQVADAEELIDHGAEVLVLSSGFRERLQPPEETRRSLKPRGCTVHVVETGEAIELYNRLRETEPVGALIHSTC